MAMLVKKCYARGCDTLIERSRLMCARHWRMVPHAEQDTIMKALYEYKVGAGARAYLAAIYRAREAVEQAEIGIGLGTLKRKGHL